jgi:hypothetical protein
MSSGKINWENNVGNRLLDYKCKTIFKSKRNGETLIDGWDVKIEKNCEDLFSFYYVYRFFM